MAGRACTQRTDGLWQCYDTGSGVYDGGNMTGPMAVPEAGATLYYAPGVVQSPMGNTPSNGTPMPAGFAALYNAAQAVASGAPVSAGSIYSAGGAAASDPSQGSSSVGGGGSGGLFGTSGNWLWIVLAFLILIAIAREQNS